jgi:bacteriocin-like protein
MNPEHDPAEKKPAKQEQNPSFIEGELTDEELRQVTGGATSARGKRYGPKNGGAQTPT